MRFFKSSAPPAGLRVMGVNRPQNRASPPAPVRGPAGQRGRPDLDGTKLPCREDSLAAECSHPTQRIAGRSGATGAGRTTLRGRRAADPRALAVPSRSSHRNRS